MYQGPDGGDILFVQVGLFIIRLLGTRKLGTRKLNAE